MLECRCFCTISNYYFTPFKIDFDNRIVYEWRNKDDDIYRKHLFESIIFERYIGLKDKKKIKIFEGDLVKSDQWNPRTYQVGFDRGGFCFFNIGDNYYNDAKYLEDFEIIGNINENKNY